MTSHSSTSNSKIRLRPIRELGIIILCLLAVELLVRVAVMSNWLQWIEGGWHQFEFPITQAQAEQLAPDLFFVGNSITKRGVMPALINDSDVYRNDLGLAYNAASHGVPPATTASFSQHFLIPDYQPETIVWIINPSHLEQRLTASWAGRWQQYKRTPAVEARLTPWYRRTSTITQYWWTFQLRAQILEMFQDLSRPNQPVVYPIEQYGYYAAFGTSDTDELTGTTNPHLNTGMIDAEVLATIDSFLQSAAAANVQVIFITAPTLHHRYPDGDLYIESIDQVVTNLETLLEPYNVPLYDERALAYDGTLSPQHFEDTQHLNRDGAIIFTQRIIELLLTDASQTQ